MMHDYKILMIGISLHLIIMNLRMKSSMQDNKIQEISYQI